MNSIKYIHIVIFVTLVNMVFAQSGKISGQIYEEQSRDPIPFANIIVSGTTVGATTDIDGNFTITGVEPGFVRLMVSAVGYEKKLTGEVQVSSARTANIDISMRPENVELEEVVIRAASFEQNAETPLSLRSVGVEEIEKNPGANRDVSRVIQSFPGVASTPAFRNDVIVRGGGPAENTFYLDEVEIPTLNHFSTQGASGGPVGIVNADFLRQVDLVTGAFPASRGDMLSSVVEMKMRNGNPDKLSFRGTLGASDLALTLEGPIGEKSTFIFSARRSYLQFLFSALQLPFLPTYNDFQLKNRIIFDQKNTLTFIGIGAIDNFRLNTGLEDPTEEQQYILDRVPVNEQWSYTIGAVYKHFYDKGSHTLVASRNYLDNRQKKYLYNDDSSEDNKILDYTSTEAENKLRYEMDLKAGKFGIKYGGGINYAVYTNRTVRDDYASGLGSVTLDYQTNLDVFSWSIFAQVDRLFFSDRLSLSLGLRMDANNYSNEMNNMLKQLSPRFSASYLLTDMWWFNMSVGRYFQRPAYTMLGYRSLSGELINKQNGIKYIYNDQLVAGFSHRPNDNVEISIEGFYKKYNDYPFSIRDSVSLASKGADYGTYGDEAVLSTSQGRAVGAEFFARGLLLNFVNVILSYTYVRSEFTDINQEYIPSAWDNKHLFNVAVRKSFKKHWDLGAKWRYVGGAPYTPWDDYTSSFVQAWDARSGPYLDYGSFNTQRLTSFHQLDVRVDKAWFFEKWSLTLYLDIQNLYNFKAEQPSNLIQVVDENGIPVIINPNDPIEEQRYQLKSLDNQVGTVLPTIGIIVEI